MVVGTVACFAAGHRALYKNDLLNMDVSYRKLCRQIVGPPPGTNWSLDWHKIFAFLERTGSTFRCTGLCQILVAVCLHSLLEVRKVWGVPPFTQMG